MKSSIQSTTQWFTDRRKLGTHDKKNPVFRENKRRRNKKRSHEQKKEKKQQDRTE